MTDPRSHLDNELDSEPNSEPDTKPGTPQLARVARSEDELLRIARGLVGAGRPPPRARAASPITQIGPTAMGLLRQTLARGVIATLLRGGGWESRRSLVEGQVRRGRVWERHRALPRLRFGPASFALLTWLHREDLVRPSTPLERDPNTTLADDLLLYLACEQLCAGGLDVHQPAFMASPLCQLGCSEFLAGPGSSPLATVDFAPLTHGDGAIVVEMLQARLARQWIAAERRKGSIVALEEMIQIGRAQTQVLEAWFAALSCPVDAGQTPRPDLAGFVAEAARAVLGPTTSGRQCPDHRWWIRSLSVHAPLSTRQAAFTGAAAFLRQLAQLGRWLDDAGVVAHFEDDYAAAQLLLSSWQYLRARHAGASAPAHRDASTPVVPASILDRAAALARTLESLHSLGGSDDASAPLQELP